MPRPPSESSAACRAGKPRLGACQRRGGERGALQRALLAFAGTLIAFLAGRETAVATPPELSPSLQTIVDGVAAKPAADPSGTNDDVAMTTVARAAARIDARLSEARRGDARLLAPDAAQRVANELETVIEKSIMLFGERRTRWEAARPKLALGLRAWEAAARASNRAAALTALDATDAAWTEMKAAYPAEALEILPALWTCPMHPEVMLADAGSCPVCGMPLDPIYETQPALSRAPIIRAEIVADAPLTVGKRAEVRIRLLFNDRGAPVGLDDLEEAHTRKIHLLIIDLSETDYHHEHPEPVGPGEYAFGFTPTRPGPYRVWADLKPVRTRVQQYAVADIAAENPWAEPAGEEPENRTAEVDGYRFTLAFDKPVIHALDTVHGSVRVVGPDGRPCDRLQVVMGAFGHFVGFRSYSTVLHMHPLGRALEDPAALGGPELEFYFRSPEPGLIRLFTQVRIGDRELFPRFVVRVAPRPGLIGP